MFLKSLVTNVLPGDANQDGTVDINDLTIVLGNFGKASGMSWSTGDFIGDGRVDVNDLTIVLSNFGQTAGASASIGSVPEPSAAARWWLPAPPVCWPRPAPPPDAAGITAAMRPADRRGGNRRLLSAA